MAEIYRNPAINYGGEKMKNEDLLPESISNMDAWFDTMRGREGYSGPVSHWWHDCLLYAGMGLDWRYEGIIIGYLNLYEKTQKQIWLKKALRAGWDIVNGQLESSNFKNSSFELNPKPGGTPHEASVDIALLNLAKVLKKEDNAKWRVFASPAKKNLEKYYIEKLWDGKVKSFRDSYFFKTYVPNKNATLIEALLLLYEITGQDKYFKEHVMPTAENLLRHQIENDDSPLNGGIYQLSELEGEELKYIPKFFPYYVARCIPALVKIYELTDEDKFINSAKIATKFISKNEYKDGFIQVAYSKNRDARYPVWVAGLGDILRAFHLMKNFNLNTPIEKFTKRLLSGQDTCGGIRTAYGFDVQTNSREYSGHTEFRDVLHVCGWNDKAFRFLTELLPEGVVIPKPSLSETNVDCIFNRKMCLFSENNKRVELREHETNKVIYRWTKGEPWARIDYRNFY